MTFCSIIYKVIFIFNIEQEIESLFYFLGRVCNLQVLKYKFSRESRELMMSDRPAEKSL